jgi:16S rRNA (uracil1498-N3)-methyltransferase
MPVRLFVDAPLSAGERVVLPPNASRHVQVLRLQPGAALSLFDGRGGQWQAELSEIGRKAVTARVGAFDDHECELPFQVVLAPGMPANERMDTLVEKATELGATAIQPLVTARSVLRVEGERAERKARHWQSIASSACEQCGRNRVPTVAAPRPLAQQLGLPVQPGWQALVLSLQPDAPPLLAWLQALPPASLPRGLLLLSGPEGGLTLQELEDAQSAGYAPVSLGTRVLRADTAPLAALALIAAWAHHHHHHHHDTTTTLEVHAP